MRDRVSSSEEDGVEEGLRGWVALGKKEGLDVWSAVVGFSGFSELARRWSEDIGVMTEEEEENVSALERGFLVVISVLPRGSEDRD